MFLNLLALKGTATYNSAANIVRVRIPTRKTLRARPGTYYYVYMFSGFKPWESHPFTLASWEDAVSEDGSKQRLELSFIFRPHRGFTSRLRDLLLQEKAKQDSSVSEVPIRLAVEGPYGTPYDISRCSSILFIMGGSGITVALSHLRFLRQVLNSTENMPNHAKLHTIRLVWAIRNHSLFDDVNRHDLSKLCAASSFDSQVQLRIDIHITGSSDTPVLSEDTLYSEDLSTEHVTRCSPEGLELKYPGSGTPDKSVVIEKPHTPCPVDTGLELHMHDYRPALHDLIFECAEEWQASRDRMAVVCSGPGSMVDDARAATVAVIGKGYEEVEFHPEMFHW